MQPMQTISQPRFKPGWWPVALLVTYGLVFQVALQSYLLWQSVNMILGLIALPMVTVFNRNTKGSLRYALVALLLGILSMLVPVNTLLYFTILMAVLFVAENFIGKINMLPLLVIVLMSPVFQYMANVFSFPVRLQLTEWAGSVMNFAGMQATVHGNMITCGSSEFSVDPACMGLNMMVTSLLLEVILVAIYQKKYGKRASWWQVLLLLGVITILNIFSNLFRIVFLVWFNIQPGTLMHEVTGIACLLFYVVLPGLFITGRTMKWIGRNPGTGNPGGMVKKYRGLHLALLVVTIAAAYIVDGHNKKINSATADAPIVDGYTTHRVSADILKLENDHSLIYIKAIPGFYSAEHNPMICWRGSGYELKQIAEEEMGGLEVYTALLQNGNDRLYTAWWYENGSNRTIDQLNWRMDALTGGNNYSVVNVTAASKDLLLKAITSINHEKLIPRLCLPQKETALYPSRPPGMETAVGNQNKPITDYE
jgi:exosortase N